MEGVRRAEERNGKISLTQAAGSCKIQQDSACYVLLRLIKITKIQCVVATFRDTHGRPCERLGIGLVPDVILHSGQSLIKTCNLGTCRIPRTCIICNN